MRHSKHTTIFILLVLLCTSIETCLGQHVSNVQFKQVEDKVVITYYLDQRADIEVSISTNGGRTFRSLHKVSGDVGKYVSPGYKTIYWHTLEEVDKICSDQVVFKVHAHSKEYIKYKKYGYACHELPKHAIGFGLGNRVGVSYKRYYYNVAVQCDLMAQAIYSVGTAYYYNSYMTSGFCFSGDYDTTIQWHWGSAKKGYGFVGGGLSLGYSNFDDWFDGFKLGIHAVLSYEYKFCSPWLMSFNLLLGLGLIEGSDENLYLDYALSLCFRRCYSK